MSVMCLVGNCIDCRWHVMQGDKLDCNFENRLRLGKPELDQYLGFEEEKEEEEKEESEVTE